MPEPDVAPNQENHPEGIIVVVDSAPLDALAEDKNDPAPSSSILTKLNPVNLFEITVPDPVKKTASKIYGLIGVTAIATNLRYLIPQGAYPLTTEFAVVNGVYQAVDVASSFAASGHPIEDLRKEGDGSFVKGVAKETALRSISMVPAIMLGYGADRLLMAFGGDLGKSANGAAKAVVFVLQNPLLRTPIEVVAAFGAYTGTKKLVEKVLPSLVPTKEEPKEGVKEEPTVKSVFDLIRVAGTVAGQGATVNSPYFLLLILGSDKVIKGWKFINTPHPLDKLAQEDLQKEIQKQLEERKLANTTAASQEADNILKFDADVKPTTKQIAKAVINALGDEIKATGESVAVFYGVPVSLLTKENLVKAKEVSKEAVVAATTTVAGKVTAAATAVASSATYAAETVTDTVSTAATTVVNTASAAAGQMTNGATIAATTVASTTTVAAATVTDTMMAAASSLQQTVVQIPSAISQFSAGVASTVSGGAYKVSDKVTSLFHRQPKEDVAMVASASAGVTNASEPSSPALSNRRR